ncbi:unnamed protein product [Echinostoma caproni]|uniref:Pecanex-like protein n=1 Tax=Echinostoma caproni TaxID=27848 RepID=A0A183ATD4_9TREM|nr:unnamed protein product [Echinostoma caproni]
MVPQIDTALTYMLEQVDIHVFGGSGAASLSSVCFSLLRALIALGICLWFCLAAIETGNPYHYLFSAFWALQVSLCFFLSRLPSNVSLYATLFPCSVTGEQFGQQLRLLVSELFHVSCFSRMRHKSAVGVSSSSGRSKRRCRPRWPWSKSRKSKIGSVGSTLEPVVWWRAWLPLLSNVGAKTTSRLSASQTGVTERLLSQTVQPTGDVPITTNLFPVSPAPGFAARTFKSFSFNELTKSGEGLLSTAMQRDHMIPISRVHGGGSLPIVSALPTQTQVPSASSESNTQVARIDPCVPERIQDLQLDDRVSSTSSDRVSKTAQSECCRPTNDLADPQISAPTELFKIESEPRLPDVSVVCPTDQCGSDVPLPSKSTLIISLDQQQQQQNRNTLTESEASCDAKQPGIPQSNTDPLPELIRTALTGRLKNDLNCCILLLVVVSALHASPLLMYAAKEPIVTRAILWTVVLCGTFLHYVWPNLRKVICLLLFTTV